MRGILRISFLVALGILLGWPLADLFLGAVREKGFADSFQYLETGLVSSVFLRTLLLGGIVAFLTALAGSIVGWVLAFHPPPGTKTIEFALLVPLVLPNYVFAIAWIPLVRGWIYSFWGCVFILTLCWIPLSVLLTRRAFAGIDEEIRDTARADGAREWDLFVKIDLPLIGPTLSTVMMLTGILVLVEFGVPSLLLVEVVSFRVFTEFAAFYDISGAALACLPILVVSLVLVMLERLIRRGDPIRILDSSPRRMRIRSTRRGNLGWVLVALGILPGILPLVVLTFETFHGTPVGHAWERGVRLVWDAIPLSLGLSLAGALVLGVVGGLVAFCLDGRFRRRRGSLGPMMGDAILLTMLAVPPALWAIAHLRFWNSAGPVGRWMTDTGALLVVGYLARFLPITYRICKDGLEAVPDDVLEAARLDGAGGARLLRFIVLPLLTRVLVVALAMAFVLVFGEISVTLLCAPPGVTTLPVRLYMIMANSPTAVVSAVALWIVAGSLPLVVGAFFVVEKTSSDKVHTKWKDPDRRFAVDPSR